MSDDTLLAARFGISAAERERINTARQQALLRKDSAIAATDASAPASATARLASRDQALRDGRRDPARERPDVKARR